MRTPTEKRTGLLRLSGSPLSQETTSAAGAPPVGFITRKESLCHDRWRTRKSNRQGAEAQRAAPRESARPATGARAAWRGHKARGAALHPRVPGTAARAYRGETHLLGRRRHSDSRRLTAESLEPYREQVDALSEGLT